MGGGKARREIFWEVHMQKRDLTGKHTGTDSKKKKNKANYSKLKNVAHWG